MVNEWIGEAIGLMHINKIQAKEVAKHIGITPEYFSMIMNGKKKPKNAEQKIMKAISEIIAAKNM